MTGVQATRLPRRIAADASRIIARLFVPGHALPGQNEGRTSGVVDHILGLTEAEVADALAEVLRRFRGRHRDITETFRYNAERIGNRVDPLIELSDERWLLLGATFTHEYAVEAAAVCNPSIVLHPEQTGAPDGAVRFIMSTRQIGEGHRSSIGFRAGTFGQGDVALDPPARFTTEGTTGAVMLDATAFRGLALKRRDDAEATAWALDGLPPLFTPAELEERLRQLERQGDTRREAARTAQRLRALATRTYTTRFRPDTELTERVIHPAVAAESQGVEDARLVRFVDGDEVTFYATYTAFDGVGVSQQLLATTDFLQFTSSPLLGPSAANKGLALFPRKVGGRYAALSRFDGARSAVTFSVDIHEWQDAHPLDLARRPWETVQVGNCGSPIETPDGWLVLTHGVGPMRTYSIGACLLDLDDPRHVIGCLEDPLLAPGPDERDGYVPNVVYSCGALAHGGTLLIPYGICDSSIGFATVDLGSLLAALLPR